ncbi:MAG TPA: nucleoside transporter C-terminal domain-containing protein [Candidatus Babeliales bacterium]|nr:nucleoside transporter C-terminal domain-containing protein [Candidatus Babeliales bacterium]
MFLPAYLVEHNRYLSLLGILVIFLIAFLFSQKKKSISYKLILNAFVMQFGIGFAFLKLFGDGSGNNAALTAVSNGVAKIYAFADEGSRFLFCNLANCDSPWGFIFGIKVLPVIIFFGALMSILFYFGIVQIFVSAINFIIRPILGSSGAETLCAIANSFLGQTEAPLLIRGYLSKMTKSEILVVMISGMATISSAIMAVFAMMGVPAGHMLIAVLMSVPGSIMMAKILYPETEESSTAGSNLESFKSPAKNFFDALFSGTSDGLSLAVNVAAMLIVFISLIAMLNSLIGFSASTLNSLFSYLGLGLVLPDLSLDYLFRLIFAPFAYLLGFTGVEATSAAELLGTKVTINELVAFGKMVKMNLSERAQAILTYALCGFANFSCIGIQVGGIGALVPEKRIWLTELGLYAVLGSSLVNILNALIVALLI